ncbi:MAG TPA: hypothetical protein VLC51_01150 [Nitrospira sp.]|nr:hypothetical protein [Nitrospira sp.]
MNYDYWRKALAGEKPKMYVDDPQFGFYRQGVYQKEQNKARKRVGWSPVAIFPNGDDLHASVGQHGNISIVTNRDRINELWSYCAGNPISEETFRAVAERGEPWPDDYQHQEVVASIPVANSSAVFIGTDFSNGKDKTMTVEIKDGVVQDMYEGTPEEKISREIDECTKQIIKYASIDSDEQSAKARSLQQRFLDLRGEANKHYEAANRPLLEQQKKLRDVWFPLRDLADAGSVAMRTAMGKWEDTKRKAAQVAAERAEAGRPVQSNVPPPSVQIKGGTGRAAIVKVETVVVSINVDQVFAQFKDSPQVVELLTSLAQKAIRAGIAVPGAVIEQRSVVR